MSEDYGSVIGRTMEEWRVKCTPDRPLRIALVNAPWARCDAPSIQCGVLKAGLAEFGHEVHTYNLNLYLSRRIGPQLYNMIGSTGGERHLMLGEWLFTASGISSAAGDGWDYLKYYADALHSLESHGIDLEDLSRLRNQTLPAWVSEQAQDITWSQYDVIGFTSTFSQNIAAVTLAERIRESAREPVIIFGGANCEGEMGISLMEIFPVIDYVVNGEADTIFPVVAAQLSRDAPIAGLPGIASRANGQIAPAGYAPKIRDMNTLPVPDYTEYFSIIDTSDSSEYIGDQQPVLQFEGSRGCWWGEKHHCTFCGLNSSNMAFRSKDADRVFNEMKALVDKYRVRAIAAVDNIMDMKYFNSLCTTLQQNKWDLQIFFEVKANLSRTQLRALRDAGITQIQPGIESLSTHILQLMRKGSTMLNNVRLLKWCQYYGINAAWNIITGFPGEDDADYDSQTTLIPALYHLAPPASVGRMWLERYSPYYQTGAGIRNVHPKEAYKFVYCSDEPTLSRLAYFFDYEAENIASGPALEQLNEAVQEWKERWAREPRPRLLYYRGSDWITIMDSRDNVARRITLDGWNADAYEYCSDKAHGFRAIYEHVTSSCGRKIVIDELRTFLDFCEGERLMIHEDDYYLSLALPRNSTW